jgi:hypothetical protein
MFGDVMGKILTATETVQLFEDAYGEAGVSILLGTLFVHTPVEEINRIVCQAQKVLDFKNHIVD